MGIDDSRVREGALQSRSALPGRSAFGEDQALAEGASDQLPAQIIEI